MSNEVEDYKTAEGELLELATVCKAAKLADDHDDAVVLVTQAERMAYRLWEEFDRLRTALGIEPSVPSRVVPSQLSQTS